MKKLVLASAMALMSVALVNAPSLRAQDSSQLTIQDPAEFNAYQTASTQSDPAGKAAALESFLTTYPQSVVKKAVLDQLIDCYMATSNPDKALSATTRLLQVDPNNPKALFYSVSLKKSVCQKNIDPATGNPKDAQSCDDSAALAQKGLTAPKPDGMSDADWKNFTTNAYPIYHSAIAFDAFISKKDDKTAISEYKAELMLYPPDATTKPGPGLVDTLQLAESYAKPDARDMVQAVWFYARAWDFAPPAYKAQIEPKLEYWYKRFHGTMDSADQIKSQIDAIKAQAQATLFPPATYSIAPAPTPAELAHHALTGSNPASLSLEDKEYILANGSKEDAAQLWGLLQGQVTPVPGIVISDTATTIKVTVSGAVATAKPKVYAVKLTTPAACSAVPAPPAEATAKSAMDYLQANGVSADVAAIEDLDKAKKIVVEPAVTSIAMAVTQDAKDNKRADFTVNLKEPLACKDAPGANVELKLQPAAELDATYDTYTQVAASGSEAPTAEMVLKDGFFQAEKKAAAPVHRKPAAGVPAKH